MYVVLNVFLCWKCFKLFMTSVGIKTCLQRCYVKIIESIVLGKEGGREKEIFSCPLQITAASHTETLERMVFVPGTTSHVKSRITHHFFETCKAKFLGQEDPGYPATPFNPGLPLRVKHLQVPEQKLL